MAAKTKFQGSFTALVTPFKHGSLDEAAFRGLVSWQIEQGSHGLVPVGTTGESPTLSHDEHNRVVEMCLDEAKGRVPVIAGAGSNSTREAVDLAVHAEKAGADADRKSTRLNSSHVSMSYAVFCLNKKYRSSPAAKTTCDLVSARTRTLDSSIPR